MSGYDAPVTALPMSSWVAGAFNPTYEGFHGRPCMSVYTTVEPQELEAFLLAYDLGALVDYQGISDGIENTNYFVATTGGRYVLTLFESIGFDDLPYYLDLMAFLAEHGVPSAHPLPDRQG